MDNRIGNVTTFGSLYMPAQKRLARVFDAKRALKIEDARKELTQVAKDVDVHIKPSKYFFDTANTSSWGVNVIVNKKCSKIFSKIYAFLENINPVPNKNSKFIFIDKTNSVGRDIVITARHLRDKVIN